MSTTTRLSCCVALLTIACGITRADISFSVTADKTRAAVGEQIAVTAQVVSSKQLRNLAIPALAPSEYYTLLRTSQNQSQSSSVQIINGQMTQKEEITYLFYYFLSATKPGTFTFPRLTLNCEGKTYASEPFSVEVVNQPAQNPDISVRVSANKDRLYVGEQALLTITVAWKPNAPVNLTNEGFNAVITNLETALKNDFSVARLFQNNLPRKQKRVGGEMFEAFELPFSIVPLNAGSATIHPVPFEYEHLQRSRGGGDPFEMFFGGGGFFGGGVERSARTVMTNPLTLSVMALPPAPSGFSGAVGSFTLNATLEPGQIPAGEAATLTINLAGACRPNNLGDVVLPRLDDFEVFSPEKHVFVDTTAQGIATRKTYKYLLIARTEGDKNVGSVGWVYFDPAARAYKTLQSQPLSVVVSHGRKPATQQQASRYLTQEEIREVGSDIRYIKTPARLSVQPAAPHRNPLFLIFYPLPFVLAGFSLLYRVQTVRRVRDSARFTRKQAFGKASRRLAALAKKPPPAAELSSSVAEVVEQYISQRFDFAAVGKTRDELRAELAACGVNAADIEQAVSFLEHLDNSRFSGAQASGDRTALDKAASIVRTLERVTKKERKA